MTGDELRTFAERYTAAWCSAEPARVAAFFEEAGSLTINGGAPSTGRTAIASAAEGFMTAFPDMVVEMDGVAGDDPIGASRGVRRVRAGRVKLHRVARTEPAVRRVVHAQRLFDAMDEQLQQRRIDTSRQPRGGEIRLRQAVPPG